jgi:hypothetical protein
VLTAASDRVVGMPKANIASLTRYSRSTGPQRRAAIAAAREGRRARAFQLDVATDAVAVDDLAQQDGAAIAQLRRETAELVAGIGERGSASSPTPAGCRPGLRHPRATPAHRDRARADGPARN